MRDGWSLHQWMVLLKHGTYLLQGESNQMISIIVKILVHVKRFYANVTLVFVSLYRLVDCFAVGEPATSVSFSPLRDLLVTTHQDNLGLYLW